MIKYSFKIKINYTKQSQVWTNMVHWYPLSILVVLKVRRLYLSTLNQFYKNFYGVDNPLSASINTPLADRN